MVVGVILNINDFDRVIHPSSRGVVSIAVAITVVVVGLHTGPNSRLQLLLLAEFVNGPLSRTGIHVHRMTAAATASTGGISATAIPRGPSPYTSAPQSRHPIERVPGAKIARHLHKHLGRHRLHLRPSLLPPQQLARPGIQNPQMRVTGHLIPLHVSSSLRRGVRRLPKDESLPHQVLHQFVPPHVAVEGMTGEVGIVLNIDQEPAACVLGNGFGAEEAPGAVDEVGGGREYFGEGGGVVGVGGGVRDAVGGVVGVVVAFVVVVVGILIVVIVVVVVMVVVFGVVLLHALSIGIDHLHVVVVVIIVDKAFFAISWTFLFLAIFAAAVIFVAILFGNII
mmetsp:Transcript_13010/g.24689  ORF Transcript_13010/g.24689 Transcript_13010/m.24689 type:complete len:338 (+) Transcript_13010:690-1703(+)